MTYLRHLVSKLDQEMEQAHVSRTLFVRNLPFTTTSNKLLSIFGDVGPIKQCFVVQDKGKYP